MTFALRHSVLMRSGISSPVPRHRFYLAIHCLTPRSNSSASSLDIAKFVIEIIILYIRADCSGLMG